MGSFNLKIHQNLFLAGAPPGPRSGSLRRSRDLYVQRLGRGIPFPIPFPLDAFGISILGAFGASLLDAFSVSIRAKPASALPSISVLEPETGLIAMPGSFDVEDATTLSWSSAAVSE